MSAWLSPRQPPSLDSMVLEVYDRRRRIRNDFFGRLFLACRLSSRSWSVKKRVWWWETFDIFFTERWDRVSPRFSELIKDNICLPTENWIINESLKEDKICVYFFLDTSGSCINLKDRFFKAARSLDPKRFYIRLFSFDTSVAELDIKKNKVYGGGGTDFVECNPLSKGYHRSSKTSISVFC